MKDKSGFSGVVLLFQGSRGERVGGEKTLNAIGWNVVLAYNHASAKRAISKIDKSEPHLVLVDSARRKILRRLKLLGIPFFILIRDFKEIELHSYSMMTKEKGARGVLSADPATWTPDFVQKLQYR